ncbi:hypothetical protein XaFJ1_GM000640 [Xanthomonas albilineans]|nr:hypothetical protein XaFJ1_GM000640 [Xanthomonas albilineans]
MVFHRKLGIYPLELAVFGFQVPKALHLSSLHAAVLGLPDVVRRLGNAQLIVGLLGG